MNYVFFDLDGTLHQQDMLEAYLKFILKNRLYWTIIFAPIIVITLLIYRIFAKKTWGLNPFFFMTHFGMTQKARQLLLEKFKQEFLQQAVSIQTMHKQLKQHIQAQDKVIILSGSLQELIELVYPQLAKHPQICVIASQTRSFFGSTILKRRCSGKNKIKILDETYAPKIIKFEVGYTDSLIDKPVLQRCKWAYLVDKQGKLTLVN